MKFTTFLNESTSLNESKETDLKLPKGAYPKSYSNGMYYFEFAYDNLQSGTAMIYDFLVNHKIIKKLDDDSFFDIIVKNKELGGVHPSDILLGYIAYAAKEWLQKEHPYLGVKVDNGWLIFNYEHDDYVDDISVIKELLGYDDSGYIEDGKYKPLDKDTKYKGVFNF